MHQFVVIFDIMELIGEEESTEQLANCGSLWKMMWVWSKVK